MCTSENWAKNSSDRRVFPRFELALPEGILIRISQFAKDCLEFAERGQAAGGQRPHFDAAVLHDFLQR